MYLCTLGVIELFFSIWVNVANTIKGYLLSFLLLHLLSLCICSASEAAVLRSDHVMTLYMRLNTVLISNDNLLQKRSESVGRKKSLHDDTCSIGPKNSVYSNMIFCPLLWRGPVFYCIIETSSKSGNLSDIPTKTFVMLQWRNLNSKQVCGLGTFGNNNTICAESWP